MCQKIAKVKVKPIFAKAAMASGLHLIEPSNVKGTELLMLFCLKLVDKIPKVQGNKN